MKRRGGGMRPWVLYPVARVFLGMPGMRGGGGELISFDVIMINRYHQRKQRILVIDRKAKTLSRRNKHSTFLNKGKRDIRV